MTWNQHSKMSKCTIIIPSSLTSVFAQDMRASALDCTAVSQIFERSLTARGKPSQSRIWLRRWKTDSWIRPLFSRTLELSPGKNSLKSWLEEFSHSVGPANPLVAQANAKQPRMNAGSSTLLQMELPLCGPVFFSPKTSKGFYQQKCQTALPFLATASRDWKAYITELRQAYSARLNAVRLTNASGCSSWPTVWHGESWQGHGATQSYAENGANHQVNYRYNKQGEKISIPKGTFDTTLTTAVIAQNWPSPVASEVRQGFQDRSRGMKGSQESLTTVVIKQHGPAVPASSSTLGSRPESWATPRAGKTTDENPETWAKRQAKGDVATMPLTAQVKTWQTATVSTGAHRQKDGSMIDKLDQQVKNWSNGKLNARWAETLMGVPVGWTMPSCASPVTIERMNSDSSVTALSQQQQNEPSEH